MRFDRRQCQVSPLNTNLFLTRPLTLFTEYSLFKIITEMLQMSKRYFNTSGPNIPDEHYTLLRDELVQKGVNLVKKKRYFTIWAPRQTGKSTYFRLVAKKLKCEGCKTVFFSAEGFDDYTTEDVFDTFCRSLDQQCGIKSTIKTFKDFERFISSNDAYGLTLIIDEIEGLNPEIFNQFLHTIRNLYHSRETHCLKSVILVGVSNITGIIRDNASPFNIADTLEVPYFTEKEVMELLRQHEDETCQSFEDRVKEKVYNITSGQPGLVNGFAHKLTERCEGKEVITYGDYLKVEDWYIKAAIDKNISNVINKAKMYRRFVERLLFKEEKIEFDIERESIKLLHLNGVIRMDEKGYIEFWVPLYKKKLFKAFYPHLNGEGSIFFKRIDFDDLFTGDGRINFDRLITNFKEYAKRRSFRYFRERDKETGEYLQIKEAALVYAFETYIQYFLSIIEGKSYLEAHAGLGRSDLIVNYGNDEYVIEAKIFRDTFQFKKGKKQLTHYCKSVNIREGIYLVFVPHDVEKVTEEVEDIEGVTVRTYIVKYDEEKDF